MIEPIKMAPCPFCEGPPCITAQDYLTGALVDEDHRCDPDAEEWPDFEAHVWCHECGATGPRVDSVSLGMAEPLRGFEVADVIRIAIEHWNERHNRVRSAYDHADHNGLNLFPRHSA